MSFAGHYNKCNFIGLLTGRSFEAVLFFYLEKKLLIYYHDAIRFSHLTVWTYECVTHTLRKKLKISNVLNFFV